MGLAGEFLYYLPEYFRKECMKFMPGEAS